MIGIFCFLGGIRHLDAPIFINEHVVKTTCTFGMISYVVRDTLFDELIERWSDEGITDANGNFVSTEISMHPLQRERNFYALYPSLAWQDRYNYSYIARSTELGDITDNIGCFVKQELDAKPDDLVIAAFAAENAALINWVCLHPQCVKRSMPNKKLKKVKKTTIAKNVKIRGGEDIAPDIKKANERHPCVVENPLERVIKLNQFPWTDKQKEFF